MPDMDLLTYLEKARRDGRGYFRRAATDAEMRASVGAADWATATRLMDYLPLDERVTPGR